MSLLNFMRRPEAAPVPGHDAGAIAALIDGFSIEVMPKTAAKVEDFGALLPKGTRVYIAHIEGTPFEEVIETAARLAREGFTPMPHFPARNIPDLATLKEWIARLKGEADLREALVLAGGAKTPAGEFHSSIQLLESGVFGDFDRVHVAGHPEGNRDIDRDGSTRAVDEALFWKQRYAETTDAAMALVTQFVFDAEAVIQWEARLRQNGVTLPVHVGIAGPAKLQTLIKFALACGVGPSVGVLQKRAKDVTKLVTPQEPDDVLAALARHRAANPESLIETIHFFPLGGIKANAEWTHRFAPMKDAP